MKVATVEKAAPATAALMLAGSFVARLAIDPIGAVLETKPDARPVTGNPKRAPSARVAACPHAPIAMIRMTRKQILWGLSA
jgi:hypothetical protein